LYFGVVPNMHCCFCCCFQVLPVLPAVVPVLLEALSGMEDARLNYVEQVGCWGCSALMAQQHVWHSNCCKWQMLLISPVAQ
jgi:hypothetical protein